MLVADGRLVISTPNRNDILFDLLPDEFPEFFYRVVHRWYFNVESLRICAERAGFKLERVCFVHRFGMSNAFAWLRDRKPSGLARLSGIDIAADAFWKGYMEKSGKSDCLYKLLKPDFGAGSKE